MSKKILSPGDLEKSLQQVVRELEEEGSTIENQREEYCDIIDDEFYSDSDQEPEIIERNDYSSDSELSADEGEAEFEPREQEEDYQFFIGKDNKTLWISQPSSSGEMQAKNIIKILPGPKGNAKRAKTEIDAFNLYITDEMVDDIVANTNIYIENNKSSKMYSRERDSKNTTKSEIKALLGALILIGIKKGSHTNCLELWDSDGTGLILLRALYSYKRFLFLMRSLRFDNIFTRDERKLQDKLAPIRDFHQKFVTNCFAYYNLSEFGTIDEMLHGFRGRCSFVQYIPNKPAKYGIKMCGLCDAKTFYTLNFEIYCGKQPAGRYATSNKPDDIVKRLIVPIENTKRNITTDNYYSSLSLAEYLLQKGITFLGTMKKNKREIPVEFLPNKTRSVNSHIFGFQEHFCLTSSVPKKKQGSYISLNNAQCLRCGPRFTEVVGEF
ncbi:piggyBac transposable element-derived protein 4-like [Dendroctonus ponderosae]|uniref:piggyBac transposable element-derived protein 4-like n=1 Tax=Dendroctonus ponderosae TaxID=77166 RepID=UPI002035C2CF|nr:piggyBac transposable element-derived protein 4-like [Dendroctonus ponderosae]